MGDVSDAFISISTSVISVKSFGFMGFLLAATKDQLEEVLAHQAGVFDLLKQVTFERD
jgi:ATP adenylyltransferase/5',5'''-P-1,P-4-tetraphosphate phosphorylase II